MDLQVKNLLLKTLGEVSNGLSEAEDVELMDFLLNHDLNTCDRCNVIDNTEELVWITAEDFEPKEGEEVPVMAYRQYDALCETCYREVIMANPDYITSGGE